MSIRERKKEFAWQKISAANEEYRNRTRPAKDSIFSEAARKLREYLEKYEFLKK